MIREWISLHAFFVIILLVSLTSANADTYTWTDEQSIVHFTDDPGGVPGQFRNKIRKLDDYEPSQPVSADNEQNKKLTNAPVSEETSVVQETYSGKSRDQWAKELFDREAAMTAVRKRIDVNADLLRTADAQEQLLAEREALLAQFNEMRADYFQQVEIARKAGLQINIKQ